MKQIKKILLFVLVVLSLCIFGVGCKVGNVGSDSGQELGIVSIIGATINGDEISMTVSKDTTKVDLSQIITVSSGATYKVFYNVSGTDELTTKIAVAKNKDSLNNGDNKFYVLVSNRNGSKTKLYTLTIHKSYLTTVYYYLEGFVIDYDETYTGCEFTTSCEIDATGYTFLGWYENSVLKSTDFNYTFTPTKTTYLTGVWEANKNTPYKVEYYFQKEGESDYFLDETLTKELTGETDTTVSAEIPSYDHYECTLSSVTDNLNGDGSTVLKVYYNLKKYTVNIWSSINACRINEEDINGSYEYNTTLTAKAFDSPGYTFNGWYSGSNLLSTERDYEIKVNGNKNIVAIWTANTDTPYFVEHYLKKYNSTTYVIDNTLTQRLTTTTGYKVTAKPLVLQDYSPNTQKNTELSATVRGDGGTVIKIYYDFDYIVQDNALVGVSTYFNKEDLVVPAEVNGVKITKIGNGEAFKGASRVKNITIGNNVTSIENHAFYLCQTIEKITLCEGIITIGEYAFRSTNLKEVVIPNTVISIGANAFFGMSQLKSVTIGSKVGGIGYEAFGECTNLEKTYYNGDVDSWASIGFYSAYSNPIIYSKNLYINNQLLEEVTINAQTIRDLAFYNCKSIKSITFGQNVSLISLNAFKGCSFDNGVTFVDAQNWVVCKDRTQVNKTSVDVTDATICNKLTALESNGGYSDYYWEKI